ncbi:MAG TPA: DAK2 domain-containing protein [Candidatus Dormibacteraeota bacterium]|nr:DAK2 domain-containing protein [Candidatus Dormibacteraeota bacterium]
MDVTALDGRAFAKFIAAGSYFLKKYRGVLNDLNVFPVPDGDTGSNMFLTARAASIAAARVADGPLHEVAAAAAEGSLMGARGNSGVIVSQMLRGFAHHVRHRAEIDTFVFATALRESVLAARQALLRPVEGTIISVAEAAAEAAYRLALHERDFYRLLSGIVRAANEALDRTPDQLPALKEAGVVDAGGAGFLYFLEGISSFRPEVRVRATAFPRRPVFKSVFTRAQRVGEHKFCTEFVIENATCSVHEIRELLAVQGESLLVIGAPPTIKVHVHTDSPESVTASVQRFGTLTRLKIDDMEKQHHVLVVEPPRNSRSIVAVVPGDGFATIARELGAEVTLLAEQNPSVRDLLLAVTKSLCDDVVLFVNDRNVEAAAREACSRSEKRVMLIPTPDVVAGIAGLFAIRGAGSSRSLGAEAILEQALGVRSAQLFFAGKDAIRGGVRVVRGKPVGKFGGELVLGETIAATLRATVEAMGGPTSGLLTLYYGGAQRERDAQALSNELSESFPDLDVEYYYGGMKNAEYWIALDD